MTLSSCLCCLVASIALSLPSVADPQPAPTDGQAADRANRGQSSSLPPGVEVTFSGQSTVLENGDVEFNDTVTILTKETRLQADRMSLRDGRYVTAEGNVLIVWEENRIAGARMEYDLVEERGVIHEAVGQVQDEFQFWARKAEKIGDSTVRVHKATFTTCTQPNPYWSFSISRATITLDRYARMWNVRFRTGKVPIVYLPYLVWPVKEDRALGLLLPEFQSNRERGEALSQKLFIPIGRSADVTLEGRYFTEAGFGGGGEVRVIPNERGSARLSGFFIRDKTVSPLDPIRDPGRWNATYNQTQNFTNGYRLVADINVTSDFQYFTDFERELSLASSPSNLARVELSRNGSWTSMNVRELRREQFFTDGSELLQQTLPEVELRGRSRQLGKTPIYLSFESSVASIQQREDPASCTLPNCTAPQLSPLDADYFRADLFPTVSIPLSPTPWIEITPRFNYRLTHYTQSLEQVTINGDTTDVAVDRSITRRLWGAGLEIVGPKLFKIFGDREDPKARLYKHSIEPSISYGFQDSFDRSGELPLYDEVDQFRGAGEQLNYGIVQRLFVKRPASAQEPAKDVSEQVLLPDEDEPQPVDPQAPLPAEKPEESKRTEAYEIATFEVRQSRSLDDSLSFADLDLDGAVESDSRSSPVSLFGRYNPTPSTSIDLRGNYNILFDEISDVTLSGSIRRQLARLRFSVIYRNGLGVNPSTLEPIANDTQLQLTSGFNLMNGKFRFAVEGTYLPDAQPGQDRIPNLQWGVQWATQCCTVFVEQLTRNFTTDVDRRDFYIRVDLKGVGKLLDFQR